jgi:integrative and conjugative element protein (TIGR02256 family)
MIEYLLEPTGEILSFNETVLEHFRRHRQLRFWSREAGGQLFAQFSPKRVSVTHITGPRRTDRRGKRHYLPDRAAENAEIAAMYAKDLHFVGDWHTHAEKIPTPSTVDLASLADSVTKSRHQLLGFCLVIVGQAEPPSGLHVSFHVGSSYQIVAPVDRSLSKT